MPADQVTISPAILASTVMFGIAVIGALATAIGFLVKHGKALGCAEAAFLALEGRVKANEADRLAETALSAKHVQDVEELTREERKALEERMRAVETRFSALATRVDAHADGIAELKADMRVGFSRLEELIRTLPK